jgi:hypothetical protein
MTTITAPFVQPALNATVTVNMANTANLNGFYVVVGGSPGGGGGLYGCATTGPTTATLTNLGNGHGVAPGTTVPAGSSVQPGAMLVVDGSDSQSGVALLASGLDCNITIQAGALGTNLYEACYSQNANVGYISAAGTQDTFLNCGTEDFDPLVISGFAGGLFIGSVLAATASELTSASGSTEGVGNGRAALNFIRLGNDGNTYEATIPAAPFLPANISYGVIIAGVTSTYYHQYTPSGAPYPFANGVFFWKHYLNGSLDTDPYAGPFGWTEPANAQGPGLAMIGAPTMNTQRRWTFEQTGLTLSAGLNTIYINGGTVDSGAFAFGDSGTQYWANCKTRVTCSVRFDTVADMVASGGVTVAGTCTIPKAGTGQNFAVQLNAINGVSAGKATIVWEIEQYVQNYVSGGSNIG